MANFFKGNFPARLDFLYEAFLIFLKMQLISAFLVGKRSLFGNLSWEGKRELKKGGEEVIFGGEDGFIIKENFEFVKNGKKDGQKGQGREIRYVKHKENKKRT